VALGTVLAARGTAEWGKGALISQTFLLVLLGCVLAHFGANVINDYFDFVNGVDTRPEHGSGVITSGQMTARQALIFAVVLFAGAAVCGLLLLRTRPEVVVPLALVGLACAVLYSAFLKRYGLGDLLIIIAFGIGLTLGAYGVQAYALSTGAVLLVMLYSLPICLLVDAILTRTISATRETTAPHASLHSRPRSHRARVRRCSSSCFSVPWCSWSSECSCAFFRCGVSARCSRCRC
jgi:1,4-dihydroxy-2-naphthoate octaprenyltransferase